MRPDDLVFGACEEEEHRQRQCTTKVGIKVKGIQWSSILPLKGQVSQGPVLKCNTESGQ